MPIQCHSGGCQRTSASVSTEEDEKIVVISSPVYKCSPNQNIRLVGHITEYINKCKHVISIF